MCTIQYDNKTLLSVKVYIISINNFNLCPDREHIEQVANYSYLETRQIQGIQEINKKKNRESVKCV